ncbi:MAG: DegT/DnrJ/EryC1/StrS family aminotransferase [bacterium]|nr:DegT/DnrJ/EryC1/StrS family aminotransferase [bacterium]
MGYKVHFVDPAKNYKMIKKEIDAAYFAVMSKGDLIMRGQLKNFEKDLAKFVGVKYAIGTNSGYDALHISVQCAGVGHGDEVIVPSHTFVATASAVVNAGAQPVMVDVGSDYNIDVTKIEKAITKKTKAIIPVHLNGRMSDMDAVIKIAGKYKLKVIEDACQSLGATFKGKKAGSIGLTGCWSFYPFKILGGYGDGGAITTNDPKVARMATFLRWNGEDRETGAYHYHGYTCLLDNLQAAFLEVKLRHLPDWIKRRREIAEVYKEGLQDITDLILPHFADNRFRDVFQNYVIRFNKRDDLLAYLKNNGVECLVHWRKPYYSYKALELKDTGFPETESISREVISLPMNVEMSDREVKYVIAMIKKYFKLK